MKKLIFLLCLVYSCELSHSDIHGTYTSKLLVNNIDTLVIKEDGSYHRTLYDKRSSRLLIEQDGRWKLDGEMLFLSDFFIATDKEYSKERKFNSGLTDAFLEVEKTSSGIMIDYGYFDHDNRYYTK